MGFNPIRQEVYDTPNVTWAVCLDYQGGGGRAMFRKIQEMLPRRGKRRDWKYYKQEHLIVIPSTGSEIYIKSQKEGQSALVGEGCRGIWLDEAMGGEVGYENFGELQMRRVPGQDFSMMFTLTPLMHTGIDWMRRLLWCETGETPHEDFLEGTFCHRFEIKDCLIENGGFWTQQEVRQWASKMPEDEQEARLRGKWNPFMERPAFSYKLLLRCMDRAPQEKRIQFLAGQRYPREATGGPSRLLRERESQHSYIASWDPSSGLGKGHDPSAFQVLDRGDLSQVFYSKTDSMGPEEFARKVVIPGSLYYNEALLVVESNGEGGGAALQAVRDVYPNLYVQKNFQKSNATYTDKLGWNTNEQSRYRMIDALSRALKEDKWTPSRDLLDEMSHMITKQIGTRKRVEHSDGFHDDLAMATAIALCVHYEEPLDEYPDFARLRIRYGPTRSLSHLPFN